MPLPTLPSAIDLSPFCSARETHLYNLPPPPPRRQLLERPYPSRRSSRWSAASCRYQRSLAIPHEELASSWCMPRDVAGAPWLRYYQLNEFFRETLGGFLYYFHDYSFPARARVIFMQRRVFVVGRKDVGIPQWHDWTEWLSEMENANPILIVITGSFGLFVICEIHKIPSSLDRNWINNCSGRNESPLLAYYWDLIPFLCSLIFFLFHRFQIFPFFCIRSVFLYGFLLNAISWHRVDCLPKFPI